MTRLLVHEAMVGGGRPPGPLARALLAEGRLMLDGLLRDFAALPGVQVVTTRDARVPSNGWPGEVETHLVGSDEPIETLLDRLVPTVDAALVVAPETGGALEALTRRFEEGRCAWLGATADAVRVAADKGATAEALAAAGVPAPAGETLAAGPGALRAAARRLGFPLVVKPADGVSAFGATRVAAPEGLAVALSRAGDASRLRVERWVPGTPASVAVVGDGARAVPLALNAQRLTVAPDGALAYRGGFTPLSHPRADEALDWARRAVEAIPGLAGWSGVDLVLPENGRPVVVEVNPRVTTAYAGLRLVSRARLSGLILEAALASRLPGGPLALDGTAAWSTGRARRLPAAVRPVA